MAKLVSRNPSKNYEEIGSVEISSMDEIKSKVQKAREAGKNWAAIGVKERIKYLKEVYSALDKRKDEISKLISTEIGFSIRDQRIFDTGDGLGYFKWYLENSEKLLFPEITLEDKNETHKMHYEPYGVAAVIQPWNFPFCQWSWAVIPNLIAGNTVVFKHSEECPLTGKLIEEIVNSTSLPDGVFNEIYGDGKVGELLIDQDIDLIVFTGSYKTGQKIYKKAAEKFIKIILELGGSAPGVVFDDADLDLAVEHIFAVRYTNCGQVCDGLKRLIVHEDIFDDVVKRLKDLLSGKKIGNPLDEITDFGPLVAKRQLDLIQSQVQDAVNKGAKVVSGAKIPPEYKGAYFEPIILTNITRDMRVWKEEIFGPVLPVILFKTIEEAVKLADDTEYGLGGYVYTRDLKKAENVAKSIKTGMVSINGANYVCPFNPFGGYKHSGIGRMHGRWGLHDVCQVKVISSIK